MSCVWPCVLCGSFVSFFVAITSKSTLCWTATGVGSETEENMEGGDSEKAKLVLISTRGYISARIMLLNWGNGRLTDSAG